MARPLQDVVASTVQARLRQLQEIQKETVYGSWQLYFSVRNNEWVIKLTNKYKVSFRDRNLFNLLGTVIEYFYENRKRNLPKLQQKYYLV